MKPSGLSCPLMHISPDFLLYSFQFSSLIFFPKSFTLLCMFVPLLAFFLSFFPSTFPSISDKYHTRFCRTISRKFNHRVPQYLNGSSHKSVWHKEHSHKPYQQYQPPHFSPRFRKRNLMKIHMNQISTVNLRTLTAVHSDSCYWISEAWNSSE